MKVGFANGFVVFEGETIVAYKTTARYSPTHERGIRLDDRILDIKCPGKEKLLFSKKDRVLPTFAKYAAHPIFSFDHR